MAGGGARKGAGRKPSTAAQGRAWCRKVVERPEVRKMLEEQAAKDPTVAMKLFEHGYGRPPQSLNLGKQEVEVRIVRE